MHFIIFLLFAFSISITSPAQPTTDGKSRSDFSSWILICILTVIMCMIAWVKHGWIKG